MIEKILLPICHRLNTACKQEIKFANDIALQMSAELEEYQISCGGEKAFESVRNHKIIFHTYWYGRFGRKQAFSIKSLLATQLDYSFEVWLWLDEETFSDNTAEVNPYITELIPYIKIKKYSIKECIADSIFKNIEFLFSDKKYLAFRADGFRMWALHEFGGFWFDLDIMFLRSLKLLLMQGEFVYAWEKKKYANNALIFLKKGSFTNEHLAWKIKRRLSTQPWTLFQYNDKKLKYLKLYPASLFDPLWNADDDRFAFHKFEDFFKTTDQEIDLQNCFPFSYTYHWHNMWSAEIEEDSWFARYENYFNKKVIEKG